MGEVEIILKKLEVMNSKLDTLGDTVTAIDLSITGDTKRGVLGIKQHIATMQGDFHSHLKEDAFHFAGLKEHQSSTEKKFTSVKGWIAGASFVVVSLTSVVVFVINVWLQSKK
jgi:iron-sulfur cluster repair protein YtfE (RIC family)